MAGRPKLPAALKKQRGTLRSYDKDQEEQEKKLQTVLPVTKIQISKEITNPDVKKAYKNHVALLRSIGAEQRADSVLLNMAYLSLQKAIEIHEQMELYDMTSDEYFKLDKYYNRHLDKFERIVKEFYLTPTARAKLRLDLLTAKEKVLNIAEKKSAVASLLERKQS